MLPLRLRQSLAISSRIVKELDAIQCPKHFVLGNHCVDTLTKSEFLEGVGQEKSYYSFDKQGVHFVVLDACFRSDGTPYQRKNFDWTDPNIIAEEIEWLEEDLAKNDLPTIVFAHHRLDDAGVYARRMLRQFGQRLRLRSKYLQFSRGIAIKMHIN